MLKWNPTALKKTFNWFMIHNPCTLLNGDHHSTGAFLKTKQVWHLRCSQGISLETGTSAWENKRIGAVRGQDLPHKQLHAKLLTKGVKVIVEPKKNFFLRQRQGFLECNLRLYKKSPGLWKHTFRFHKKAAVEHVFGLVKLRNPTPTVSKAPKQAQAHGAAFLLYNLNLLLTQDKTGRT